MGPSSAPSSDRRAIYRRIAPLYDIVDGAFEYLRYRHLRPQVFEVVEGADQLLDCGVGTGRNIPYYPPETEVTGVDIAPEMLDRARDRANEAGRRVRLLEGDVRNLPFDDNTFDAAVATFLFCVIPDDEQPRALREVARVLEPGGRLVLLDYRLSTHWLRRLVMRLWAPLVRRLYGASFTRRTPEHLRESAFEIDEIRPVYRDIIHLMAATNSQ